MANISNSKSDTLINGSSSVDSIVITGSSSTINSAAGDDKITLRGATNTVYAGAGNDYIYDDYSNTFNNIYGETGNDTIISYTGRVYGGEGNDIIRIGGPATAVGGTGNDTIYANDVKGNGIFSRLKNNHIYKYSPGDGNDVIIGYRLNDTVDLGTASFLTVESGNDIIVSVGSGSILLKDAKGVQLSINGKNASTGKFTDPSNGRKFLVNGDILNRSGTGSSSLVTGSDYNDIIYNYANKATIQGKDGDDWIWATTGDSIFLDGGNGDDELHNGSCQYVTLNGGKGNDSINSGGSKNFIMYANGDGDDTISGYNSTDTIQIANNSYSTKTSGSDVIINVGSGSMLLKNAKGKTLNIVTIGGDSPSPFTEGDDVYRNAVASTILSALGGNDSIVNSSSANSVQIYGDAGNDTIDSSGDNVTIFGGADNDSIGSNGKYSKVFGGDGNDDIRTYYSGPNTTIDAGNGNDYIQVYGNSVSVDGGADNDEFFISNISNITVKGGTGNDTINNYGLSTVIQYKSGDGNDVITGYKSTDKIQIAASGYSTAIANTSDILISVGDGSMLLKNAKGIDLNIDFKSDQSDLDYVKLTNKDKSPYNAESDVGTVSGAEERTKAVKIVGNDKPNVLIGGTKSDTLVGGGGVDTFVSGAGKDYVTDYAEGEVVSLAGSLTKVAASGNNVTLTSSKGKMVLTGAKGKKVNFVDVNGNTTKQTFGVPMLNVVDGDGATINTVHDTSVSTLNGSTRTQGVTLIGNKNANTIIGGSGDDILTSGAGKDLFVYTGGNDVITDYAPGKDTIKLDGASITSVSYTGSQSTDLVLTTDKGTLTIENAMSMKSSGGKIVKTPQKITIIQSDGTTTSQTYKLAEVTGGVNTLSGNSGNDTIYGFSTDDLLVSGAGKDVFIYGSGHDTISDYAVNKDEVIMRLGAPNNYSINGSDAIFNIDSNNSLTIKNARGKTVKINGSDIQINDFVNVTLDNKSANPYIATDSRTMTIDAVKRTKSAISITGNANNNTITGGKKNDTLTGGAGADTFIYTNGYGNDVITDYSANDGDIIQLGNKTTVTDVTYSNNDLILTFGKGKLTVQGAASQSVTVVDKNDVEIIYSKRRSSTDYEERIFDECWFTQDDNFVTDDININSILQDSSSSVIGQVNTDYNIDAISINKQSTSLLILHTAKAGRFLRSY